ncbi:MAG: non-ribosomal peptide synthetase [Microcoleaceae cyanobacterium]
MIISSLSEKSNTELIQHDELSELINSEDLKFHVSSLLALLSTAVYRNTYNETFSIPVYSYINNSSLGKLPEAFVKRSFTFDSNRNPTLEELSRSIEFTLESSDSEKTTINNDDTVGIIVVVSEKPLSQERIDAAKTLHQLTKSELTCIVTNTDKLVEIYFVNSNSSRYQRIPKYLCNLANAVLKNPSQCIHTSNILSPNEIEQQLSFANAVLKNPSQCIHTFNILSPDEIEQQLRFSRGEKISISDRPVYKEIEAFASKTPNALAVSSGLKNLSYGELNSEANKLAHFLLQFPVTIGDKVVAFVQRSTDIIKAILAIHKVGAVYVPIDPAFPKERILAILQEVKPKLILTHSDGEEVFENIDIPRLNLEHSSKILDSFPSTNPEINVNLDNESHIFFTSGTTGKPKGVVATHRNLVQYLSVACKKYKFCSDDKFISAARFTFSISLFEILTPLFVGGAVRIVSRDVVLNLPQLCEELQKVTVFHFGPSLLKQLLPYIEENFPDFSSFNKLRHVSSGGDMVPPEILEKLKKIFVNAEVYVIYGSSEISCMGCTYEVPRDITLKKTKVGKPHQNMSVRIFDKHGNMVPIGAPGKLYFAGDGVVKGYLNLENLTAEKFIQIDGQRFYSIGDIGGFDTEGNIELLGRDDFQVQIRGMRVELPEIEYYLKCFPAISDCVVVGRVLENNTDTSLVAYLVLKSCSDVTAMKIREHLSKFLADYMVPTVFVKLDKLPTNYNAKLDRSQLPSPKIDNILVTSAFKKSSDAVETVLIEYWEKMFNIQGIGVNHDFFELGGDSLLAVQFLMEVQKRYGQLIPISTLLEISTIKDLAAIIRGKITIPEIGNVTVLKQGNGLLPPPILFIWCVVVQRPGRQLRY